MPPAPRPPRNPRASAAPALVAASPRGLLDFDPEVASRLGETLRRLALGLTAALLAARFYFPSEAFTESQTGRGLVWVVALFVAAFLGIAGAWVSGRTLARLGAADVAVVALMALVWVSARGAAERRIATNLSWEWAGLGLAYILLRALPRSRAESSAIAAVLVGSAAAVAAFGLYQVAVEFPEIKAAYKRNPESALRAAEVDPSNAGARANFEARLLGSKEPYATFALANSLAGVLVAGAAMAVAAIADHLAAGGPGRARRTLAALVPAAILLACLLLTKSRSAYLGLGLAAAVVALRLARRVPARALLVGLSAAAAAAAIAVTAAFMFKQLDVQVLTESTKSLRYRMEYWRGAWGVINESPGNFWRGVGPGNFAGPYLGHKAAEASEEVADPHDAILEVWSTAGLPAMIALVSAVGLGSWAILRPTRGSAAPPPADDEPTWSAGPIVASGAIGGLIVVVLLGEMDPIGSSELLARWLALGAGWGIAAACGFGLWRRGPIAAAGAGAAVLAMGVNLLAAGGIGIPSVALMLWAMLAIGLNLRDDAPSGRPRLIGGRWAAFGVAVAWSMGIGTFLGQVRPHWLAEAKVAESDAILRRRPIDLDAAQSPLVEATQLDPLAAAPHIDLARSTFLAWSALRTIPGEQAWFQIDRDLHEASKLPRNPRSLAVARYRASYALAILERGDLPLSRANMLAKARLDACLLAASLYPTSASIRADLADAFAAREQFPEAAEAARRALDLDRRMPHADKKLPAAIRRHLDAAVPLWETPDPARGRARRPGPSGPIKARRSGPGSA